MSEFLPPVVARMTANIREFQARMGEARHEMDKTTEHSERSGKAAAAGYGKAIATGAAVAGAAVVGYSLEMGMSMQTADSALAAHGDLSQEQAKRIGDAFLNTGMQNDETAQEIVTALGPVSGQLKTLSGHALTVKESMDFMNASLALNDATGGDLNSTTSALATTLQTFGMHTKDAAGAADMLWNVANAANVKVDTLTGTFQKLHAKLGPITPSMGDLSTAIYSMSTHGVSGKAAVAALSGGMTTLLSGSKATADTVKLLGLHLHDSSGKFVGMRSVLEQLSPKLKGMTEQQRMATEQALFGKSAAQSLNATLLDGAAGWDKSARAAQKHGTAATAAEKAEDNLKGQMERLQAAVSNLATRFGEWLIPQLMKVVRWVQRTAEWMSKHQTVAKALAGVVGGILLVAIGAYAASMASAAAATLAATWPVLAVVAAVGAIVAGFLWAYKHVKWFHDAVDAVARFFKNNWKEALETVGALLLGGPFGAGLVAAYNHVKWFHDGVNAAVRGIVSFFRNDLAPAALWLWRSVIQPAAKGMGEALKFFWNDVAKPYLRFLQTEIRVVASVVMWLWRNVFSPALQGIGSMASTWWAVMRGVFNVVMGAIREVASVVGWLWHNVFSPAFSGMQSIVSGAWGAIRLIASAMSSAWSGVQSAVQTLGSIWGGVWDGIKSAVSSAWSFISGIIDKVKRAIDDLKSIVNHIPGAGLVKGGLHALGLARGTRSASQGVHLVGEQGPELVELPNGASVYPHDETMRILAGSGGGAGSVPTTAGIGGGDTYVSHVTKVEVAGSVWALQDLAKELRTHLLREARGNPAQDIWGSYAGT